MDRYTKIILTIIAINSSPIVLERLSQIAIPEARAQNTVNVRVVGGRLDYETDVSWSNAQSLHSVLGREELGSD